MTTTTSQRAAVARDIRSPFRSHDEGTRQWAAEKMIDKRVGEAIELESQLATALPRARKILRLRLAATLNNHQSWVDYIGNGCPRQPRAVIVP